MVFDNVVELAPPRAIEEAKGSWCCSPQQSRASPSDQFQATTPTDPDSTIVGDVHAHAPSLAEVKRELTKLNLCGGVTNRADAQPVVKSAGPGFKADPGTGQTEGQLPELTAQLNALGKALGLTIYGISGYRTPAQSWWARSPRNTPPPLPGRL